MSVDDTRRLPDARPPIVPSVRLNTGEKERASGRYPYSLPALRNLHALEFHPHVTFFVGENGSGKSTLLEALAVGLGNNPEGGGRNFRFKTRDSHSELADDLTVVRSARHSFDTYFFRAESFYNLATEVDNIPGLAGAYGGKSLHEQSHGESFFALFENRLRQNSIYLLDEPEAALSPQRQMTFLALLHQLVLQGSQFIVATHSPILMAYPLAWIYSFDHGPPRRVEYTETEHYQVTKMFLTFTDKMLRELMTVEDPPPALMKAKPRVKRKKGR